MTEKFFVNGLMNNILPIVMGAHADDYRRSAPPNSFIHVDEFKSPKELAHFLLSMDEVRYESYFKWKRDGEFINTYFWCRLCASSTRHVLSTSLTVMLTCTTGGSAMAKSVKTGDGGRESRTRFTLTLMKQKSKHIMTHQHHHHRYLFQPQAMTQ